eukprot:TRINITY_DN64671_c0_g1_i1.p1 TRINITY_DN64671_c0_g1~~TRINITY_DN64671_c0_g1_i1.p1  ORF type:complete len:247 (-),score=50.67 TRINITY_DN64671_c0_g1_i1:144-884(-)
MSSSRRCRETLVLLLIFAAGVQGVRPEDELVHQRAGASARQRSGASHSAEKSGDLQVASAKHRSSEGADAPEISQEADVNHAAGPGSAQEGTQSHEAHVSQAAAPGSTEPTPNHGGPPEEAEVAKSNADTHSSDAVDLTDCDVGNPEEGKLDEFVTKLLGCAKQRQKLSGAVAELEKLRNQDLETYRTMVSTIVTQVKDEHGHGKGLTGPFEMDHTRIKATLSSKLNEMLTAVKAWPNAHAFKGVA